MHLNDFSFLFIIALTILCSYLAFRTISLKKELDEMERLKKEIYNLGENMSAVDSKEEAFELILDSALSIIEKVNKGSILMRDDDGLFRFKAFRGYPDDLRNIVLKLEEIYLYKCNKFDDTAIITNPSNFNRGFLHKEKYDEFKSSGELDNIHSVLSSPIKIEGELIGIINIDSMDSSVTFNQDDIKMMKHIKNELELSLKNFLAQEQYRYRASHDELTDLYNRRILKDFLNREIAKANKEKIYSQLVLIDLDKFKSINDTYGHETGDKALLRFAEALKEISASSDICARMSGDEFVIIFSDLPVEKAEEKLEILKDKLASREEEVPGIEFSYGIISITPETRSTAESLFKSADKKMYYYKNKKGKH